MEEKLISVIIPVYNASKYLDICLDSMLKQTYSNFELILVNDGSTDNSLEICNSWANNDKRIKVFDRENGGASAARNTGLNYAQGEYVVFVDSDDYVSLQYLENLYLAAEVGGFDIVQCNLLATDEHFKDLPQVIFSKDHIKEITKNEALNGRLYKVSVTGKIYASHILAGFRFKEGIIYEDDASYYIFVYDAKKIAMLNETLYYYYQSQDSVMRNNKGLNLDFLDIYEQRKKFFKEKNEVQLYNGSIVRFCIILVFCYATLNSEETGLKRVLLDKYYDNFKQICCWNGIPLRERVVCYLFYIAPSLASYFIRKTGRK